MSQIELSTTSEIANRKILSQFGIVIGVGTVAFGPFTSVKAARAYTKAVNELKDTAQNLGANAVIGITATATGSGFAFSRGQTVILTGTAVKVD